MVESDQLYGQIPLQLSPKQEIFLVPTGLESAEKSVTLSDAPR